MLVRQQAMLLAVRLRSAVPGVTRIVVARRDGRVFFDQGLEETQEPAAVAAASASQLGIDVAAAFRLGYADSVVVHGERGMVLVQPLDAMHVVAVHAEPSTDVVALRHTTWEASAELTAS
ncbi:hypothetical protein OEB99_02475 [Actinotalea sp. M2MS4P-6]|uniref:hypothetical protein n=1 Tax=Actinotalea sp. M2MS4P-6 TaxID=2983762 RepID=UPI0021E3CCD7|nr:hypothetical protein [Actinotalea sp. M2MS4P-6]MCV2393163.1 hypothetical protein [Actinotalea sp. M2MS4P-6]